jgi:hypothetical protein
MTSAKMISAKMTGLKVTEKDKTQAAVYAQDTVQWEEWQRDYRLGLILILPPPPIAEPLNHLRQKYDPRSQAICPAHISISDPLRCEMTADLEAEISGILGCIEPFELHYSTPQASVERAGIACQVGPQDRIDALKEALHLAAAFAGQAYRRRDIPAHLTIAEFISIEEGLKLIPTLRRTVAAGSFVCDRLEFVVPDEAFCFRRKSTFFLGAAS